MTGRLRALDRRLGFGAARIWRRLRWGRGPQPGARLPGTDDLRRVLVVRLDSIGDIVLTTPMLQALRRHLPAAHITLVVRPEVHGLIARCPHVDRVLAYPEADARPRSAIRAWAHARRFAAREFAGEPFDIALLPRWEDDPSFASLVAVMSGARWRVGYRDPDLLTHVCPSGPVPHEVARNLDVVRLLGAAPGDQRLALWLDDADQQWAGELLAAHGAGDSDEIVALGPGATNPRRRWPIDRFAEVAEWSLSARGGFVLVVGGDDDRALGAELQRRAGSRVIDATGRATLRQTAALLRRCALFVGNDSAPMHLAAAAGIPVVEVSCHPEGGAPGHPNSPIRFGPWGVPHRIARPAAPAPPCTDGCAVDAPHCIERVAAADVIAHVSGLLSGRE